MTAVFTIGQLARAVGVNIQTVRYYERRRLLTPVTRKPSGYRLYGEEEVRRLRFIKNGQRMGFTLREITELLALEVATRGRCTEVQRRALAKLEEVEEKIADLQSLSRALRDVVRACQAGHPIDRCPIINSLERERRGTRAARPTGR
jgi:MerR family mercuric resistance operon transcriptional regulator/MerR family gold-responsive transcriptional activator of gol and ges genes